MDINKFKPIVERYIFNNFDNKSQASRHYGHHTNYLNKCFGGQRPFPKSLLDDMGWEVKTVPVHIYTKKKGEES